jgi:hypothetical protein
MSLDLEDEDTGAKISLDLEDEDNGAIMSLVLEGELLQNVGTQLYTDTELRWCIWHSDLATGWIV